MTRAVHPVAVRPTSLGTAILALLVLAPSLQAQGPQGHIDYIFPAGARQGTTVDVTVSGTDLAEAQQVRVTGEGVTGTVGKIGKNKTLTVSLTVAPDAPPGERDLRLLTVGGVTNRARFIVGQIPEILEKEPNSDVEAAQELPSLPVVVNGQIMAADKDIFRFTARAGQTIVCQVQAQSLLPFIADAVPGWFQSVLTLYDATGRIVAYVDDYRFHPDPVLIFHVEHDGEYRLEIKDCVYRGREDFVYRLSVGQLPFITHLFPLGAQRQAKGTASKRRGPAERPGDGEPAKSAKTSAKTKVELFGVNLPVQSLRLDLSQNGHHPVRYVHAESGGIQSNEMPFAVGDLDEVLESEPNDTPAQANAVELPVTINGRIGQPGDVDCFAISAEAKQRLVFEVHARRLESPLDSILVLMDASGKTLAKHDDIEDELSPQITHHADSRLVYTFRSSGKYVVRIGDVQGKGGPEFAYRLTMSPPQPDFELRALPDTPRMGQGATGVVVVQAVRRDGFDGQIDLSLRNLPDGFTASGTTIAEDENETILSITSPNDVPLGSYFPSLYGRATIGDRAVTRRVMPVEDVMQAFYYHHMMPTEEMALSIVPPGPFKLIPVLPPEGFIRFGGGRTAFLKLRVERTESAKGSVKVALYNPPKGVRMSQASIGSDAEEVEVEIRYPNQMPSNVRYNLIAKGTMKSGKKESTVITPVIVALGPGAKAPKPPKTKAKK